MWVETLAFFGIILLITIGFLLVTLFSIGQVGFAYGLIIGDIIVGMIASLVMSVLMAIGVVVMGIAIFILYKYEKAGSSS
jgi:hypothetical protein